MVTSSIHTVKRVTPPFPAGGGETAVLLRERDWSATPLGPLERWPDRLRSAVEACLASAFPSFLWWGDDLVQFYNDAAIPIVKSRHPEAFGIPARRAWADAWETIGSIAEGVLATGETASGFDVRLAPEGDGPDRDARFTFSAAPTRDARGRIVGLSITAFETTAAVRTASALRESAARQAYILRLSDALRPLDDPGVIRRTAARVLREHLGANRVLYTEARGDGELDFVATDQSPDMPELQVQRVRLADYGAALAQEFLAGRTTCREDVLDDPANTDAEKEKFAALRIRAWANTPLVKAGRLVAMVSMHFATPHAWSDKELALLEETAERTWAAAERARAEAALRDADRRKDEFLATLAHELRNPLAPIRNGLQIARRSGSADPAFAGVLDMMERQLSHLVRLVDDLLDIGRISAGKIELRRAPVRLADVVATSIEASRATIDAHGHEFSAAPVPDDLIVEGDFHRLAQVFSNLLTNAAKYTGRGGHIRLSTSIEEGRAAVRVADDGIGIPREDLPRVFDLFSQVRTHQGLAEGGLGIGLSLARRLVEMHGGSIEVSSDGSGRGSTFCVYLPCLDAGRDAADADGERCEPLALEPGRRVLVVDDNVDAAESLAAILRQEGHAVRLAHDGRTAISAYVESRPDVVILDLGMPDLDGVEVARVVRALPEPRPPCLIALTGWGQEADKRRTQEAGFDWHLVKPADPAHVLRLLRQAVPRAS